MNRMLRTCAMVAIFCVLAGCSDQRTDKITAGTVDTTSTRSQETSGNNEAKPGPPAEQPTPDPGPPAKPEPQLHGMRLGKHKLTLQWISWDRPGSVIIKPSEDGEWFPIEGSQRNDSSYLTLKGLVRPLNEKELVFQGKIESKVPYINQGKVCVREGAQVFRSTKGRKYWRLQNMINCEGGLVTDYVDIYF